MKFNKDLARAICEELGIEWDESATEFTLQGRAITPSNFDSMFSWSMDQALANFFDLDDDSDALSCVEMRGASSSETYDDSMNAILAA